MLNLVKFLRGTGSIPLGTINLFSGRSTKGWRLPWSHEKHLVLFGLHPSEVIRAYAIRHAKSLLLY
jgi:hypothetical protein